MSASGLATGSYALNFKEEFRANLEEVLQLLMMNLQDVVPSVRQSKWSSRVFDVFVVSYPNDCFVMIGTVFLVHVRSRLRRFHFEAGSGLRGRNFDDDHQRGHAPPEEYSKSADGHGRDRRRGYDGRWTQALRSTVGGR